MNDKIKFFLIVGEASGDVLGAKLMAALRDEIGKNPDYKNKKLEFIGIGGPKMKEQGLDLLFPMEELSLIGIAEIIPHIPRLLCIIKQTAQKIITQKPNFLITIDAPDFSFRVVKEVRKNVVATQIKKIHFIAPTVWAWREGRAKKIAALYDLLLVILPFEPPYFSKYGLKTIFVGHPIIEQNQRSSDEEKGKLITDFRQKYKIRKTDFVLCLTPGSRIGEVKKILPEMVGAINILAKNFSELNLGTGLKILLLITPKTSDFIASYLPQFQADAFLINESEKNSALFCSNFALAKSGTNTLELAIAKLPMIVVYKVNFITHLLLKIMVKVKFANLINLILNKAAIPEMLQNDCRAAKLAAKLEEMIKNPALQKQQIEDSKNALKILGMNWQETPSRKAAKAVLY